MNETSDVREFVFGVILSGLSWEAWENVIVSLTIAFLGGFLAAAGKLICKASYDLFSSWRTKRKSKK